MKPEILIVVAIGAAAAALALTVGFGIHAAMEAAASALSSVRG